MGSKNNIEEVMRIKVLKLLLDYTSYITPEEGANFKAIDENDFEELSDSIVKLFEL